MSISQIMTADQSGAELVDFARREADKMVRQGLTRAQIRNIFTEVRKIEALWEGDKRSEARRKLNMLKPKLDYQTARERKVQGLRDVLAEAIDEVEKAADDQRDERFRRFVELFEAILAYHRALGGRN